MNADGPSRSNGQPLGGLRQIHLSIGEPDYWKRWLADRCSDSD